VASIGWIRPAAAGRDRGDARSAISAVSAATPLSDQTWLGDHLNQAADDQQLEGGNWQIVRRHADLIITGRSITSIVANQDVPE